MLSKLFHGPAATVILIACMLFAQQVVRSAESGATDFDDTPTPLVEFQAYSTTGRYAEALAVAARVVEQASDHQSATRAALVEPLLKLATVRRQSGDYVAASRAGELAIDLIERNGGVFDPALVEPLVFLAQLEQASGHHPAALERLYRAQHIVHRSDGVMSLRQLPILSRMTKSYVAMKQRFNTNLTIDQAYAIILRKLDENSIDAVPFIIEQAQIKTLNRQFKEARALYHVALGILERSLTENDPGFVDALSGLASVRYAEQVRRGAIISLTMRRATSRTQFREAEIQNTQQFRKFQVSGRRLLRSASRGAFSGRRSSDGFRRSAGAAGQPQILFLRSTPKRIPVPGRREGTRAQQEMILIMEEHPERYSEIELAETHIRLGDWFMLIRKPDLSVGPYRAAWQILANQQDARELLASYFGQPKTLKYLKPTTPKFGPGMYENYDGKYVEVRYTVNENGTVRNLQLADSNSPAAMNTDLRAAVKRAIFRPRYADGKAVATDDLFFREEFSGMLWWLAKASAQ